MMIGGKVVSGDFFDGLKVSDTPQGQTFKRKKTEVEFYPPRMTVEVFLGLGQCTHRRKLPCDRCEFGLSTEFVEGLQFKSYWKNGFTSREADLGPPDMQESGEGLDFAKDEHFWKVELLLQADNVPLSDALVLVISSKDGKTVSRLAGRLKR